MDMSRLSFDNYNRRFGVEIEVNALDGRDFIAYPLGENEIPAGMNYIGELLSKFIYEPVSIQVWHYTHDNEQWVIKSDRSCGIELCSPVSIRWNGLDTICSVIDLLNKDPIIQIDSRCSLHVHVNVADCTNREVAAILAYWIKSEPVFIDFLPSSRKRSRYFEHIGAGGAVEHNFEKWDALPRLIGIHKYMTVNTFHRCKHNRQTIEFRIMGNEGCLDSKVARNWIILVMHFLEMAKERYLPPKYHSDDVWSGLVWMDPREVMQLLGFMGGYELSSELIEVRKWFLHRLKEHTGTGVGFWGKEGRKVAIKQVDDIIRELNVSLPS